MVEDEQPEVKRDKCEGGNVTTGISRKSVFRPHALIKVATINDNLSSCENYNGGDDVAIQTGKRLSA